jgi:adsorption protein B
LTAVDQLVSALLVPLFSWVLISGVDDAFVALVFVWRQLTAKRVAPPPFSELRRVPPKRIAVFVPLWREDAVVASMVEHNVAAVQYANYAFYLGVYPNDVPTVAEAERLEEQYPNVRMAVCPHDGPTSKADCLNWIYQRMLLDEEVYQERFDVIVTHDAEDVIEPGALLWINHYSETFDFIQVPVLPLKTPALNFVHGVYCDEFSEYQAKDVIVRQALGGFLPSNGVGTGYRREIMERLAKEHGNRIFDPESLTEDYENGYRIAALGGKQMFVPLGFRRGQPMATREFFPRTMRAAIKQRTRWVTGNVLQSWQRHGWGGGLRQLYWWWRDRKGLIGNPASLITNLISVYVACCYVLGHAPGLAPPLLAIMLFVQAMSLGFRATCVGRIYGWGFAALAPARAVTANVINASACARAMYVFLRARLLGEPLVWLKTDHAYPSRATLLQLAQVSPTGRIHAAFDDVAHRTL